MLNKNHWPHSIYQIADSRGKKNKRIAVDGVSFPPVKRENFGVEEKIAFFRVKKRRNFYRAGRIGQTSLENKFSLFIMKIAKSKRKLLLSIRPVFQMGLTVLISVLIISTVVKAGTITPPSGGGEPSAKFYTISEIYNFVTNNTTAIEGGHDFTFSDSLAGTGRTLTEIYDALASLISADKVKLGTTYLNVAGTLVPSGGNALTSGVCNNATFYGAAQTDWNLQTGSLNPAAGTILNGTTICGVAGTVIPNPTFGDNNAAQVLNTAANPGTYDVATCTSNYNTLNLSVGTVKTGTTFGNGLTGEYPSASYPLSGAIGVDAAAGDIRDGLDAWNKTGAHITGTMPTRTLSAASETVSAGYYDASTLSAVDTDLAVGNIKSGTTIFGILGTLVAYLFGDNDASKVLTTATGVGTYNAANLSIATVKKGTAFGVSSTGEYSGYPGTGWSGTAITQVACDAQNASGWYWFEDGNGDGDITDPEDGLCVKTTAGTAGSWNGDFFATQRDNSYIAAYTCSGSFPSGIVATYSGIDAAGAADNTFNNGDCALCQADCYDGQKDLPDQGGYTTPSEAQAGIGGPITPEVLKNWKGTRLPTSNDFFGFCGATSGDIDSTAGDSAYHSSGASSSKTIGNYGGNAGRGANAAPNDEYVDLSNSGSWEWLSEQHYILSARIAGYNACSNFTTNFVYSSHRFRAVFRP